MELPILRQDYHGITDGSHSGRLGEKSN
jgi:hypothetical protein